MRKIRGALVAGLAVTAGGFSTGCDSKLLEKLVWDGLVPGIMAEIQEVPGLIVDEIKDHLGLDGQDDNGEGDNGES